MTARAHVALLLAVAGLAGILGGVVGMQMIHGPTGRNGAIGPPGALGAPGPSAPSGATGAPGNYGPHMALLLIDGQVAIVDASAVESSCAVLQSPTGCQIALGTDGAEMTANRSFLLSDTDTEVPAAERALETDLVMTFGSLLTDLGTCGQRAIFGLEAEMTSDSHAFSSVVDTSVYWLAVNGCASAAAPFFVSQVKALRAWDNEAAAYAGP